MDSLADTPCIDAAFKGKLGQFSLDIAFAAPMRGVTALFGPSGCGKTTILRAMAGLTHMPGRLAVGADVWQDSPARVFLKPHRRPVGYVFQEESLFPHLSVRQNLLFGARRGRTTPAGLVLDIDDVVALLGIGHLLERAPRALSGGERQRVTIGRALLSRPQLLLMDEPLSALDQLTKDEILPYLENLHATLAIPILYVSHDISEVARLADRIVVMAQGRMVTQGPAAQVLERLDLEPVTDRFEAGVILMARILRHDRDYALTELDYNGQTLTIPLIDAAIGEVIRLRVRARDVAVATQMPVGISVRNILPGVITQIAQDPGSAYAETLIDIGGANIRARLTRASVADLGLAPGRPVFALVKSITF